MPLKRKTADYQSHISYPNLSHHGLEKPDEFPRKLSAASNQPHPPSFSSVALHRSMTFRCNTSKSVKLKFISFRGREWMSYLIFTQSFGSPNTMQIANLFLVHKRWCLMGRNGRFEFKILFQAHERPCPLAQRIFFGNFFRISKLKINVNLEW